MSNGRRHRRWGHGTAAVARHLSDSLRPITQKELAAATNLTQPTVSNVLRQFSDGDAASANRPGWLPRHPALLDLYHENYASRLDDNEASWYRIDDISAQVDDLIKRTADLVLSGDTAADVINPWRIPTATIAYSAITNDQMEALGFVIAETRHIATIIHTTNPPLAIRRGCANGRPTSGCSSAPYGGRSALAEPRPRRARRTSRRLMNGHLTILSASAASDGAYIAVGDISSVLRVHRYRLIGGVAVMLHQQRLALTDLSDPRNRRRRLRGAPIRPQAAKCHRADRAARLHQDRRQPMDPPNRRIAHSNL